jgi:hypothetical protein
MLGTWTQMEHGKHLRARVDDQPEPQHLFSAAQPCAQFIQLEIGKLEMTEEALVQGLCVLACTSEPRRDGGLSKAKDPFGGGGIQSFGQRSEHYCDLMRRGFQAIQGCVASSTERGVAGLTAKGLDALGLAMFAIPNQGVDVSVCDPGVQALWVGTSEAVGVHLTPGPHWRRSRSHTGGAEATEWAIKRGAGLEQMVDQRTSPACL